MTQENLPVSQTDSTSTHTQTSDQAANSLWKRLLALGLAISITVFIYQSRDFLEAYAVYGYPSAFIISVLGNATLILPAPSYAIVFALGGVLNPLLLGFVAGAGAATGELTGYLLGYSGRGSLENNEIYQKLRSLMDQWGLWLIFALGLIPNPFFDVGGVIAGAMRLPWWQFWLVAALGKGLCFAALAWLGAMGFAWWGG